LFCVYIATVFPHIFSHVTTVTPTRSIFFNFDSVDSRVDPVDFVDRAVDKIEVDFVANVYEALGITYATLRY